MLLYGSEILLLLRVISSDVVYRLKKIPNWYRYASVYLAWQLHETASNIVNKWYCKVFNFCIFLWRFFCFTRVMRSQCPPALWRLCPAPAPLLPSCAPLNTACPTIVTSWPISITIPQLPPLATICSTQMAVRPLKACSMTLRTAVDAPTHLSSKMPCRTAPQMAW